VEGLDPYALNIPRDRSGKIEENKQYADGSTLTEAIRQQNALGERYHPGTVQATGVKNSNSTDKGSKVKVLESVRLPPMCFFTKLRTSILNRPANGPSLLILPMNANGTYTVPDNLPTGGQLTGRQLHQELSRLAPFRPSPHAHLATLLLVLLTITLALTILFCLIPASVGLSSSLFYYPIIPGLISLLVFGISFVGLVNRHNYLSTEHAHNLTLSLQSINNKYLLASRMKVVAGEEGGWIGIGEHTGEDAYKDINRSVDKEYLQKENFVGRSVKDDQKVDILQALGGIIERPDQDNQKTEVIDFTRGIDGNKSQAQSLIQGQNSQYSQYNQVSQYSSMYPQNSQQTVQQMAPQHSPSQHSYNPQQPQQSATPVPPVDPSPYRLDSYAYGISGRPSPQNTEHKLSAPPSPTSVSPSTAMLANIFGGNPQSSSKGDPLGQLPQQTGQQIHPFQGLHTHPQLQQQPTQFQHQQLQPQPQSWQQPQGSPIINSQQQNPSNLSSLAQAFPPPQQPQPSSSIPVPSTGLPVKPYPNVLHRPQLRPDPSSLAPVATPTEINLLQSTLPKSELSPRQMLILHKIHGKKTGLPVPPQLDKQYPPVELEEVVVSDPMKIINLMDKSMNNWK